MRKIMVIVSLLIFTMLLSLPVYAGIIFTPEEIMQLQINPEGPNNRIGNYVDSDEPYLYLWSEGDGCYMPYENPKYYKDMSYVSPRPGKDSNNPLVDPELGITKLAKGYTVYSSASTVSPIGSIGSAKSREIVRINSDLTSGGIIWHNITYKTATGTKSGFIQASNINIPSRTYSYEEPCTSGTFTHDHGIGDHVGVDIAGSFSLYAVTSDTVNYKHTKFKHPSDDEWYLVSYGNYAQQSTSNGTATYAHLSAFASGGTISTLPSMQLSIGSDIIQNNKSRLVQGADSGSGTFSAGAYIGTSGSTGNSTGNHLHFEMGDPFRYVLFPDYGYVN